MNGFILLVCVDGFLFYLYCFYFLFGACSLGTLFFVQPPTSRSVILIGGFYRIFISIYSSFFFVLDLSICSSGWLAEVSPHRI